MRPMQLVYSVQDKPANNAIGQAPGIICSHRRINWKKSKKNPVFSETMRPTA